MTSPEKFLLVNLPVRGIPSIINCDHQFSRNETWSVSTLLVTEQEKCVPLFLWRPKVEICWMGGWWVSQAFSTHYQCMNVGAMGLRQLKKKEEEWHILARPRETILLFAIATNRSLEMQNAWCKWRLSANAIKLRAWLQSAWRLHDWIFIYWKIFRTKFGLVGLCTAPLYHITSPPWCPYTYIAHLFHLLHVTLLCQLLMQRIYIHDNDIEINQLQIHI